MTQLRLIDERHVDREVHAAGRQFDGNFAARVMAFHADALRLLAQNLA